MQERREAAREVRSRAADLANGAAHPAHVPNGDEEEQPRFALSFTKGLPHDRTTGVIAEDSSFDLFVDATNSGDSQDFIATPLGPEDGVFVTVNGDATVRGWESQGAGHAFDLQGPDAQAVTMPPAPKAGSAELIAEMAEVYAQAVIRDIPLSELRYDGGHLHAAEVDAVVDSLNQLSWFDRTQLKRLSGPEKTRRRSDLTRATAFRGITDGDEIGPYLSQFLLVGSTGLRGTRDVADGFIQYGSQTISQRVQEATDQNFMTSWDEWFDVQNGLDARGTEQYLDNQRFITTGRDLATYVHFDALYQAYLNACLILLDQGVPFDDGIPFQEPDVIDHQQGFAHFGAAHILTLVPEVATRALKAVRFQKFNVHRRLRPEALAARVETAGLLESNEISWMRTVIDDNPIADMVRKCNHDESGQESLLLPMAFPEGSPMHPSYGAGHATVAGACVTILKAFFDHTQPFAAAGTPDFAFVASTSGDELEIVPVLDAHGNDASLTVEGELNKLAANISIGRDWAGVHYFSDYWESMLMGEEIAIGILREQKLCFQEPFTMTIPRFSGGTVTI